MNNTWHCNQTPKTNKYEEVNSTSGKNREIADKEYLEKKKDAAYVMREWVKNYKDTNKN